MALFDNCIVRATERSTLASQLLLPPPSYLESFTTVADTEGTSASKLSFVGFNAAHFPTHGALLAIVLRLREQSGKEFTKQNVFADASC